MVWIRIRARVDRSSTGFWLFAILLGECNPVGIRMGPIPVGPGLERGCFHRQQGLPLAVKGLTTKN